MNTLSKAQKAASIYNRVTNPRLLLSDHQHKARHKVARKMRNFLNSHPCQIIEWDNGTLHPMPNV
jgi:hypothetical protein